MSSPRRDLATRYLALVAALLPGSRRAWGDAMRAELAAIDDPSKRRRFALGCTSAIAMPGALIRSAAPIACLAGLVALSTVIGPVVPLSLILALLFARACAPADGSSCWASWPRRSSRGA